MALVGINPTRPREKKDTLDKIAQGVDIAATVLGAGMAIPKFLQDRKEFKQLSDIRTQQLEQEKIKTDVDTAKSFRPASKEEVSGGLAMRIPGSRVFADQNVVLRQQEKEISDFDKNMLNLYAKDYRPANPDEKGDFELDFGGKKIALIKRDDPQAKTEVEKRSDNLRGEYLKQSKDYIEQSSAYQRVLDSSSNPSAAGDLALIFNYMKVLDPGSTVREGEFANAENSGGIPDRIRAQYNKVRSGERLSDVQRSDFVDRAGRLYKGAQSLHGARVKFYSDLAESRDLPVQDVVPSIGVAVKQSKKLEPTKLPSMQEAGDF